MTKPPRALDEFSNVLENFNDDPSSNNNSNEGSSHDSNNAEINNDLIEVERDEDVLL